jgi:hypothetical protein
MKITLGDAAACHLFVKTKFPDGIDGAAILELQEAEHVGFQVRHAVGDPMTFGEGDFGTYLGSRKVSGPQCGGKKWWIVAIKFLAFDGYKSAELYDSFEELKREWVLE